MRANIKLQLWIPLLFIIVVGFFLTQEFNLLDIVMIVGGSIIVGYFVLGFVRRKEALQIEENRLVVTTPFKRKEYALSDITEIYYNNKDKGVLHATVDGVNIPLITNIYDVALDEIKAYLLAQYPHISTR